MAMSGSQYNEVEELELSADHKLPPKDESDNSKEKAPLLSAYAINGGEYGTILPQDNDVVLDEKDIKKQQHKDAAVYVREGEDNDKFYQHPRGTWSTRAYQVLHCTVYHVFNLGVCTVLLFLALMEHPYLGEEANLPQGTLVAIVVVHALLEILLLFLLWLDMLLRLVWLKPKNFFTHKRTILILVVLVVMSVEAIVVLVRQQNHFRITRALRPIFLVDTYLMHGVRRVLRQIFQCIRPILDVILLLILSLVVFSLLGFLIFAELDVTYFASFKRTLVSFFIGSTTSNHPDIWLEAYIRQPASALFFILYIIVMVYFISNVLLAMVYSSFGEANKKKFRKLFLHKRNALRHAYDVLATSPPDGIKFHDFLLFMHKYRPRIPEWKVMCIFKALHMYDEGDTSPSNDEGGTSPSDDEGGTSPRNDEGGTSPSDDKGGTSPSNDEGGTSPSNDEGGTSPSNDEGGTSPSNDEGGISPSNDEGGTSPSDDKGGTSPSNDEGGTSPSNDEGVKDLSLEQFYGFYEVINLKWKQKEELTWFEHCHPVIKTPANFVYDMVENNKWFFKYAINTVVMANLIFLVAYTLYIDETDISNRFCVLNKVVAVSLGFVCIYVLEIILKIFGMGPYNYFRKPRNIVDFLVILTSFVLLILEAVSPAHSVLAVFRPVKFIRLLHLKRRYHGISKILYSLSQRLISVGLLLLIVYYAFAIIGMEFFSEAVFEGCCNESMYGVGEYYSGNNSTFTAKVYYVLNFDNIFRSYVTLFVLMVINNWYIIMEGFASTFFLNDWLVRIYFMSFYLFTLVVLQVVLTFIVDAFMLKIEARENFRKQCLKHPYKPCTCHKNEDKKVANIKLIKADIDKLRYEVMHSDQTEGVSSLNKWIRHWRRVNLDSLTDIHNLACTGRKDLHLFMHRDDLAQWINDEKEEVKAKKEAEAEVKAKTKAEEWKTNLKYLFKCLRNIVKYCLLYIVE
ncbi:two pore channel protein 1-like isoform X2 [Halichondria panicea]|uniref:two pore channel protein 1-like isoform X2 n=1 Tax=Halichondria panicea TaxID=6063 RepID=UPI00312B76CA